MSVSVSKLPSSYWTPVTLDLGPTLIPYNLVLTNYIFKDPISKSGHIPRLWVDMNFGWTLLNTVYALIEAMIKI